MQGLSCPYLFEPIEEREVSVRNMQLKAVAKDIRKTDMCAKELRVAGTTLMRYRGAMAGIVRSMGVNGPAVEDVVHDAFEMACRKAEGERPDPEDEGRYLSWLCTLAKFAALTTRNDNARSREVASPSEELEDVPEPHRAYIGRYDDKVAASVVLSNLSDDDRTLIHEHFFEDRTVQELAEERGVPWTTMRSRIDGVIHRARSIMDDKAARRRGFGAMFFGLLGLRITDIHERMQLAWSRSRHSLATGLLGLVAGTAIVAAMVQAVDQKTPLNSSIFAGTVAKSFPAGSATSLTSPTVNHAPVRLAGLAMSPLAATFPQDKPKKDANSKSGQAVKDPFRERVILPWGISAAIRDHDHEHHR